MDSSGFRWPRGPGPRDSPLARPFQPLAGTDLFRTASNPPPDQHSAAPSSYSDESTSSSDYSDDDSSSASSWSSDRSAPEWESHVDAEGDLFYVVFGSNSIPGPPSPSEGAEGGEDQNTSKQKTKTRLGHLLKRRRRKKSPQVARPERPQQQVDLPPLDDWSEWTSFTIELEVNPSSSNHGHNLCESLLGFVPGSPQIQANWGHSEASLRHRVVVEQVLTGPLDQGSHVQRGDWLEKLNDKIITHRNLNDILAAIHSHEIVALNFRRRPPSTESPSTAAVSSCVHGLLLLSQEGVDEGSAEFADVLYRSETGGADRLLKWRGVGPTLTHLMPQLNSSAPVCSTVVIDETAIHLAYVKEGQVLLLMAAPSTWCSAVQLQLMAGQMELLLRFQYGSIRRALTEERHKDEIRRLADLVFQTLRTGGAQRLSSMLPSTGQRLHVASDVHLDVILTLNQMESMDYEDWDDVRLTIERSVSIVGSCVHFQGYLVASTLSDADLEQVGAFLKWNQLLEMSRRRRIKSLVVWRRVWPHCPQTGGRPFFVLVVGSGHILVSALLECAGPCAPWDRNPDSFLIQEMQHYAGELEGLELEPVCNKILNGPENPALASNLAQDVESPDLDTASAFNITAGMKPTMINYLLMDFGTGVFISPTSGCCKFVDQFQETALAIHRLFRQTLRAKADLLRPDWGGPWSDKNLIALQEVSVMFAAKSCKDSFWVAGRLFAAPTHKELYVCYQEGVPQDLLDLAFHLALGAVL